MKEASNGAEALQVWDQEGGAFDLLFTDMVMPEGISGSDLCSRLSLKKASLKTIITSVYSSELADDEGVVDPRVRFLSKPYNMAGLAALVRECLDRDRSAS